LSTKKLSFFVEKALEFELVQNVPLLSFLISVCVVLKAYQFHWWLCHYVWSCAGSKTEDFLADFLVAPGISFEPLPSDAYHVQVGNSANLQFE